MEVTTGRGCEEGRRMRGSEVAVAGKCFLASSCLEVFVHCTDNRKDRCHFSTLQTNNAHSGVAIITTVPIVGSPYAPAVG